MVYRRKKVTWIFLWVWFLISGFLISCSFKSTIVGEQYENANEYSIGDFTYEANAIEQVLINWYVGEITIHQSDQERLSVHEENVDLLENEKIHYLIKNQTLRIQFWESNHSGIIDDKQKKLTVEIPLGISLTILTTSARVHASTLQLDAIKIITTSSSCRISSLNAKEASFTSTSGKITIDFIEVSTRLDVGTISGNIILKNVNIPTLHLNSTSGTIDLEMKDVRNLEATTISGKVKIHLQDDLGAVVVYSTISGEIFIKKDYTKDNGYKIGNGTCQIKVVTTSGNLIIQ